MGRFTCRCFHRSDLFYNTGIATYIWVLSKNKRPERKGKIQLIDASTFFKKLRKALGDKKNEISPEDRSAVTKLYADFAENEYCKIYRNEEFIYREYTVMQPLQRSYAITEERIQVMVSKGALDSLYNEVKFADLELMEDRDGKAQKQLNKFFVGKPIYDAILANLNHAISDTVWMSPDAFMPHLTEVLSKATTDKKLLEKIADGLSVMDKNAEIQRDRKGNVVYDKETKDTELVKWEESIEDYMAREVLPHIPDAAAFFEEDLGKKKPVIKTGAEIPFTRYFYKYQQPTASEELEARFSELELGEIYTILFIDNNFRAAARDKIKKLNTRAEMYEAIDALQESTAWHILVGDEVLTIIKDNFDLLKEYRNDVMHAHNISWEKYKKAKKLFTDANDALERELNQLLQYPSVTPLSEKTASTLYEKMMAFNAGAEKIGTSMASALEVFAKIAETSVPKELSANLEKMLQLLASAALPTSDDQSGKDIQSTADGEVKENE